MNLNNSFQDQDQAPKPRQHYQATLLSPTVTQDAFVSHPCEEPLRFTCAV